MFQHCTDNIINLLIYRFILIEPQFHLSRMHIHIDQCRIDFNMKGRKRIFVNHDKCLISILNCLCNNVALDITAINKIILPCSIASGQNRFADKSCHMTEFALNIHFQQLSCHIPSVNLINDISQIAVAGGMKPILIIVNKFKGYIRMGQCQSSCQIINIGCLRGCRL